MGFIIHFFYVVFLFLLFPASQLTTLSIRWAAYWSFVLQESGSGFAQCCKPSALRLTNWTLAKQTCFSPPLRSSPANLNVQKASLKKKASQTLCSHKSIFVLFM